MNADVEVILRSPFRTAHSIGLVRARPPLRMTSRGPEPCGSGPLMTGHSIGAQPLSMTRKLSTVTAMLEVAELARLA